MPNIRPSSAFYTNMFFFALQLQSFTLPRVERSTAKEEEENRLIFFSHNFDHFHARQNRLRRSPPLLNESTFPLLLHKLFFHYFGV
jgi:hypothetical protein